MAAPRTERVLALDMFRGLTVAAMILVNNPGEYSAVYRPLQHASWNGCTPTDLIFPFFLFITGVAIPLALDNASRASRAAVYSRIGRRALVIFALGLFLNGFPMFDWSVLRVPGVLQRIAICYAIASAMSLELSAATQGVVAFVLVVGYWLAMTFVPVPGAAVGAGPEWNLAAFIDDRLLHGHLLHDAWDPEGLLSTVSALATTLCGVLTGQWLRTPRSAAEHVRGLLAVGGIALSAGFLLHPWLPINKNLWSSSFVIYTAGAALSVFGACYWLTEVKGLRRGVTPFVAYGTNALVAYVLSTLVGKLLYLWQIARPDGSTTFASHYLFETLFLPLASPVDASLLYALTYMLLWMVPAALLYRQHVLIKI